VGAPLFSCSLSPEPGSAPSLSTTASSTTLAFPSYPGATIANCSFELNGTTPGNSCNMLFHLKDADRRFNPGEDSASVVFDFYQNQPAPAVGR
jgi:hypothetical protein